MTLKERTAAMSLLVSFVLAAVKLAIGLSIGSLALITDALHSATDFLATGMTWIAVRYGDRPADASHPYGHGKFENVAALGEATLLLLLAGGVLVEAIARIRNGGEPPPFSTVAVIALVVEIAAIRGGARELRRVGRQTQSAALQADALHFSSDVLSSFAVLGGFALVAIRAQLGRCRRCHCGGRHHRDAGAAPALSSPERLGRSRTRRCGGTGFRAHGHGRRGARGRCGAAARRGDRAISSRRR
jgi:divalent metal cation (Fe/Co/Zn/Cd) transporter